MLSRFASAAAVLVLFCGSARADVVLGGEQLIETSPVIAPGNYDLDITLESLGVEEDIQALQFELDFNNPDVSFVNWAPAVAPQIPFVGNGSSAGFTGIGMTNLSGALFEHLAIGTPTVIGTLTIAVETPVAFAEVPFGGAIEFRDPSNNLIAFSIASNPSISTAIPEPGAAMVLGLCGLAMTLRRRRNAK
ncbi:MAG: MYXO-CTERM sorting domain-containing protein [Planctomycetota bacterium]